MKQGYYKLPLRLSSFFEANGGQLDKCSELESIDQHIEMLLTTCPGEHHFDSDFGCRIWELDFQVIASLEQWEKLFKQYIHESIVRYETRLTNLSLDIYLREVVKEERANCSMAVRKRADVYVTAQLISTDEPIKLRYTLYLGPLSNE